MFEVVFWSLQDENYERELLDNSATQATLLGWFTVFKASSWMNLAGKERRDEAMEHGQLGCY